MSRPRHDGRCFVAVLTQREQPMEEEEEVEKEVHPRRYIYVSSPPTPPPLTISRALNNKVK